MSLKRIYERHGINTGTKKVVENACSATEPTPDELRPGRDFLRVSDWKDMPPFLVCVDDSKYEQIRQAYPDTVVYRRREVQILAMSGICQKAVRRIHTIKREFPGSEITDVGASMDEKHQEEQDEHT